MDWQCIRVLWWAKYNLYFVTLPSRDTVFVSFFFPRKILHLKHSSVWFIWFYLRDHSAKVFNRTFRFKNLRERWPRLRYEQIVYITLFECVNFIIWLVLTFLKFHFSSRIIKMFQNERRQWRNILFSLRKNRNKKSIYLNRFRSRYCYVIF